MALGIGCHSAHHLIRRRILAGGPGWPVGRLGGAALRIAREDRQKGARRHAWEAKKVRVRQLPRNRTEESLLAMTSEDESRERSLGCL